MKLLLLCAMLLLPFTRPVLSQIIYSGEVNIPVPMNLEGLYLNPYTGDTSLVPPSSWDTDPWLNAFWGGNAVGTNSLFTPLIAEPPTNLGDGRLIRLNSGEFIDGSWDYAVGDNGSDSHTGTAAGEFALDEPGFLGFRMLTLDGVFCYGWMEITVNNDSTGTIHSWAWNSNGDPISAGLLTIPEPSPALLLAVLTAPALRRKRRAPAVAERSC